MRDNAREPGIYICYWWDFRAIRFASLTAAGHSIYIYRYIIYIYIFFLFRGRKREEYFDGAAAVL